MELCISQAVSNLPSRSSLLPQSKYFRWHSSSLRRISPSSFNQPGLRHRSRFSLRSSFSDETSTGTSSYVKDEPDGVITMEDTRPIEYEEKVEDKTAEEDSPGENQLQPFEILDKLDLKLDSDDTYSILLLGGGALAALYLATAIVGAVDSIPLIPKLLEVVGLSYTVWFISRYLLFKQNREELAAKIEELKQQVLG